MLFIKIGSSVNKNEFLLYLFQQLRILRTKACSCNSNTEIKIKLGFYLKQMKAKIVLQVRLIFTCMHITSEKLI